MQNSPMGPLHEACQPRQAPLSISIALLSVLVFVNSMVIAILMRNLRRQPEKIEIAIASGSCIGHWAETTMYIVFPSRFTNSRAESFPSCSIARLKSDMLVTRW